MDPKLKIEYNYQKQLTTMKINFTKIIKNSTIILPNKLKIIKQNKNNNQISAQDLADRWG